MRVKSSQDVVAILAVTVLALWISCIASSNVLGNSPPSNTQRDSIEIWDEPPSDAGINLAKLHREAVDDISTESLREHLRYFTRIPHASASSESHQLAEYIQDKWQQYGLDRVELKKYNVLISDPETPGSVVIQDATGKVLFRTAPYEKALLPEEYSSRVLPPYNAYSPSGKVTAQLIYAYYGRRRDFRALSKNGINVTGKIVIMRYAKGSRAAKVLRAQINGAVGVIFYPDPWEYAADGLDKVYPAYNWLPSTGVQRGNVKTTQYGGDPLTPGRPAVDGIYRIPMEEIKDILPLIPVHPISYGDAMHLISMLDGKVPDPSWVGGLPIIYGVQSRANETRTVTLTVDNRLYMKDVYNVIGVIRGDVEPDHLVIIGNHRDAWVFGGTDGSSGISALMEVARVLGELAKKGWRPKRSIVFASWGAEEPGTIGSTEWVEEHAKLLQARAVAYINVDMSVDGNQTFRASATPLMENVIMEASKKVPGPGGIGTLYEDWVNKSPSEESSAIPRIRGLGFSSDHGPFYSTMGIPSLDLRYTYGKGMNMRQNPLYHTLHDSYHLLASLIDPDFKYQQAVTRAWTQCILDLADSSVIPFHVTDYGVTMVMFKDGVLGRYREVLEQNDIPIASLDRVILGFAAAAKTFQQAMDNISTTDAYNIQRINHRLVQLERAFINNEQPPVLASRPLRRHVLLTRPPASRTPFMAGLVLSIRDAVKGRGSWEDVKQQLSHIVYAIQSATHTLSLNPI